MTRNASVVSLTGIKPTGRPHIGNYLGAIRPALGLAQKYTGVYFIADYHALTTEFDGAAIRKQTIDVAATWLALGLDPKECTFFLQSDIPEVCELSWILTCFTSMGLLNRGHAFKDAAAKGVDVNHGIFAYPVLMAADILLYGSNLVPVGKDQKQHVEICRDIANAFNHTMKADILTVPEPEIQEDVATVPGLDGRKMSKSYGNTIEIFSTPDELKKRLAKIVTGSEGLADPKDPEKCNVFSLYKLFAPAEKVAEMAALYRAGGFGFGHAKQRLFEAIDEVVRPSREKFNHLVAHPDEVYDVLQDGAKKARERARPLLERVRSACGFGRK